MHSRNKWYDARITTRYNKKWQSNRKAENQYKKRFFAKWWGHNWIKYKWIYISSNQKNRLAKRNWNKSKWSKFIEVKTTTTNNILLHNQKFL